MRKVKVAAIQPAYIPIPRQYGWASENFRNIPEEIIENYVKKQIEVTTRLLEKAGSEGCDIVSTSEDVAGIADYIIDVTEKNIYPQLVELAQPIIEGELSRISQKYSMYIIGCYNRIENGNIYNSGVIFDRKGCIIGEYRKTHLPSNEKWQCVEGNTVDVFELDFGKIGICICYDMMFQEVIQVQALKGAEITFHPTLGYGWYDSIGEATLRTRANDNSVYIITAKNYANNSAGKSSVVDFWGHVLVDAGFYENVVITKEIDLDFEKNQPEGHYITLTSGIGRVDDRKLMERRPELYKAISEKIHKGLELPDYAGKLKALDRIKSGE